MSTGWTKLGGTLKKKNGIVSFDLRANSTTALSSVWTTVATLPEGYRPQSRFHTAGFDDTSSKALLVYIEPSGIIALNSDANPGLKSFFFSATYITD